MKHLFYKTVGALYIVLALPSLGVWLWSDLFPKENYFLVFSIGGLPLGLMLFLFGSKRWPTNKLSAAALKTAMLGLSGYLPFVIAFGFLAAGNDIFIPSLVLAIFFITFATLIAFTFAVLSRLYGTPKKVVLRRGILRKGANLV